MERVCFGGQRKTYGSQFFPFLILVPGIKPCYQSVQQAPLPDEPPHQPSSFFSQSRSGQSWRRLTKGGGSAPGCQQRVAISSQGLKPLPETSVLSRNEHSWEKGYLVASVFFTGSQSHLEQLAGRSHRTHLGCHSPHWFLISSWCL